MKYVKFLNNMHESKYALIIDDISPMTKEEVRAEIDRIFTEYTDPDDISNALLELPADLVDDIFSEY